MVMACLGKRLVWAGVFVWGGDGGCEEVLCLSLMVMDYRRDLWRVWAVVVKVGLGLVSSRIRWCVCVCLIHR